MRLSSNSAKFVLSENNELLGICLGNDGCAEHGNDALRFKKILGVPEFYENGVQDRLVTRLPNMGYQKYKTKDGTFAKFFVSAYPMDVNELGGYGIASFQQENNLSVHWSNDSGFVIVAKGKDNILHLEKLKEAFENQVVALGNDFLSFQQENEYRGQVFLLASKISSLKLNEVYQKDQGKLELRNALDATGIKELLKESNKKYYAFEPAWIDENKKELKVFLNPAEQSQYKSGWYSIEQLRQWAHNCGPIIKAPNLKP